MLRVVRFLGHRGGRTWNLFYQPDHELQLKEHLLAHRGPFHKSEASKDAAPTPSIVLSGLVHLKSYSSHRTSALPNTLVPWKPKPCKPPILIWVLEC